MQGPYRRLVQTWSFSLHTVLTHRSCQSYPFQTFTSVTVYVLICAERDIKLHIVQTVTGMSQPGALVNNFYATVIQTCFKINNKKTLACKTYRDCQGNACSMMRTAEKSTCMLVGLIWNNLKCECRNDWNYQFRTNMQVQLSKL